MTCSRLSTIYIFLSRFLDTKCIAYLRFSKIFIYRSVFFYGSIVPYFGGSFNEVFEE